MYEKDDKHQQKTIAPPHHPKQTTSNAKSRQVQSSGESRKPFAPWRRFPPPEPPPFLAKPRNMSSRLFSGGGNQLLGGGRPALRQKPGGAIWSQKLLSPAIGQRVAPERIGRSSAPQYPGKRTFAGAPGGIGLRRTPRGLTPGKHPRTLSEEIQRPQRRAPEPKRGTTTEGARNARSSLGIRGRACAR